jgi:hypothetical protein
MYVFGIGALLNFWHYGDHLRSLWDFVINHEWTDVFELSYSEAQGCCVVS